MEPRAQDLEQTSPSRPDEKKRRFRLVKLEEQRFHMDRLEERIAPTLVGGSAHSISQHGGGSFSTPTHQPSCR
jgi:hypothetical protein